MEAAKRCAAVSLDMLFADMKAGYDRGNYVICGGDFNHNLRTEQAPMHRSGLQPFPRGRASGGLPNGNGQSAGPGGYCT